MIKSTTIGVQQKEDRRYQKEVNRIKLPIAINDKEKHFCRSTK